MKKPENAPISAIIPLVPDDTENEKVVWDQLRFIVSLHHPLQTAIKLEIIRRLENLPVKNVAMKPPSG